MPRVVFTGWRPPFDKVLFNQLLRSTGGQGLGQAKQAVDRLLDGETVSVDVSDGDAARQLAEQSRRLGASCHVTGEVSAGGRPA